MVCNKCVQYCANCAAAPAAQERGREFSKATAQRHATQVSIVAGAAARAQIPKFRGHARL